MVEWESPYKKRLGFLEPGKTSWWSGGMASRQVWEDEWVSVPGEWHFSREVFGSELSSLSCALSLNIYGDKNTKNVSAYLKWANERYGGDHLGTFKCRSLKAARDWADALPIETAVQQKLKRFYDRSNTTLVTKRGLGEWLIAFGYPGYDTYPSGTYTLTEDNRVTLLEVNYAGCYSTRSLRSAWQRITSTTDTC